MIGSFDYTQRNDVGTPGLDSVETIELFFSNDGNFAATADVTINNVAQDLNTQNYALASATTTQYVRFQITGSQGNIGGAEVSFYDGVPGDNPDPVDPTGFLGRDPTSSSASSFHSAPYVVGNLYDGNIGSASIGTPDNQGAQYAGNGAGPHVIVYDMGASVDFDGIYYAQRLGDNPATDKVTSMQFWVTDTNPGAASTGMAILGSAVDRTLSITNTADSNLTEYGLGVTLSGRYVVMRLTGNGGNPGGSELWLRSVDSGSGGITPGSGSNEVENQMLNINATAYARIPFEVTGDPARFEQLTLNMKYDDGFVAYLNGVEVARRNANDPLAWDSAASVERTSLEAAQAESIDITSFLSALNSGTNILAFQGLNSSAADDDFTIGPELLALDYSDELAGSQTYLATPTPGALNSSGIADIGPFISNVLHSLQPAGELQVTAQVTPSVEQVGDVALHYRSMYGAEQTLVMFDDGLHGDGAAADGIYGAAIPSSTSQPGEMLRYYLTANDTAAASTRAPLFLDSSNSAEYFGTVIPDTTVTSALPILLWFAENAAASETSAGTSASLFFDPDSSDAIDGEFYDNIYVRIRGFSTRDWPKHKFKFDFNPGDHFRYDPNEPRVEEFNLQSHWLEVGGSPNTSYMREDLAFEFFQEVGTPAPDTFFMQVQRNNGYYGMFSFVEQIDDTFLKKHGFDTSGAMYKAISGNDDGTLRVGFSEASYREASKKDGNYDDLRALTEGLRPDNNPNRTNYLYDNINLPQVINEMAAHAVMIHHDRLPKNYYMYQDPRTDEWSRFPWDVEMAFAVGGLLTQERYNNPLYGDSEHSQVGNEQYNRLYDAILDDPVLREMYMRRLRTFMGYLSAGKRARIFRGTSRFL